MTESRLLCLFQWLLATWECCRCCTYHTDTALAAAAAVVSAVVNIAGCRPLQQALYFRVCRLLYIPVAPSSTPAAARHTWTATTHRLPISSRRKIRKLVMLTLYMSVLVVFCSQKDEGDSPVSRICQERHCRELVVYV